MLKLNYSVDSWHYRFLKKVSPNFRYKIGTEKDINFCWYWRTVLVNIVFFTILTFITAIIILRGIQLAMHNPVGAFLLLVGIIIGLAVLAAVTWAVVKAITWWHERPQSGSDGFILEAYKSFKEKTCKKVDFT